MLKKGVMMRLSIDVEMWKPDRVKDMIDSIIKVSPNTTTRFKEDYEVVAVITNGRDMLSILKMLIEEKYVT